MKSRIQQDPADQTASAFNASVQATIQHLIEYIDVFCNGSLEGIIVLDRQERILYLNPVANAMFAASNQDCQGQNIWQAFPDFAHDVKDRIDQARVNSEINPIKGEYPRLHKSLRIRVKRSALNIFLFVQEIDSVSQDTQHTTRRARLLGSIVANMSDAVIVTDPQGQILVFNPAAEKMTGFKADELMGQSVNLFVEPEIGKQDNALVRMIESIQGHDAAEQPRRIHMQTKDSANFPVEIAMTQTKLEGQSLFICIVKDRSDHHSEENMTKQPVQEQASQLADAHDESDQINDAVLISTLLEEEPDLIDLIEIFLEQYPSYIERCQLQFASQDWAALADTLHSLVGMAGGYGYPIITDTARLAETELKKQNYEHISEYLHKLERFNTMAQRGYQRP